MVNIDNQRIIYDGDVGLHNVHTLGPRVNTREITTSKNRMEKNCNILNHPSQT